MNAIPSGDTPSVPEAPSEERYLTAQEIAAELGQPLYRVKRALAVLAATIRWKEEEREGKRVGPRLYHASGLAAIVEEIGRRRKRAPKQDAATAAYWRARASLRLLKRDANALAKMAGNIYELLKRNPLDEQVIAHALPHSDLTLRCPVTFRLRLVRGRLWQATLLDLPVMGNGMTQEAATQAALKKLAAEYLSVEHNPSADSDKWHLLRQLVHRLDVPETHPETVVVEEEAALTVGEWLDENAPEGRDSVSIAWRRGACARFYRGRKACSYSGPNLVKAWDDGFATMSHYLEDGGVLACDTCLRPLALI